MTKQLIQIEIDMKKLENKRQEKVNIILLDVYWNMNMSKIIID